MYTNSGTGGTSYTSTTNTATATEPVDFYQFVQNMRVWYAIQNAKPYVPPPEPEKDAHQAYELP